MQSPAAGQRNGLRSLLKTGSSYLNTNRIVGTRFKGDT